MKSWQQLSIIIPAQQTDLIADTLEEQGALSVTFTDAQDQPLFQLEPEQTPVWQQTKVLALFSRDTNIEPIIETLNATVDSDHPFNYDISILQEEDWVRKTQQDFPPQCFAEKLWVLPSWCEQNDFTGTILKIDPGLAFGTGTHPTTSLCLSWLANNPPKDNTVIDYGCGSGILALAALALGAHKVYAVDHDPQAWEATQNNANLNAFINKDNLDILSTKDRLDVTAPLLIANILSGPLIELLPTFLKLCTAKATLILSGILVEESQQIIDAYGMHFQLVEKQAQGEWTLLHFAKTDT